MLLGTELRDSGPPGFDCYGGRRGKLQPGFILTLRRPIVKLLYGYHPAQQGRPSYESTDALEAKIRDIKEGARIFALRECANPINLVSVHESDKYFDQHSDHSHDHVHDHGHDHQS